MTMFSSCKSDNTYLLSIDNHQEMISALMAFCEKEDIRAGLISGLGAIGEATLRFYDPQTKKYVDKTFREQMEGASIIGNISTKDGKPYLHVHVVLGRRDYTCIGGHLLSAFINGACELSVVKLECESGRKFDEETGLNMYDFK